MANKTKFVDGNYFWVDSQCEIHDARKLPEGYEIDPRELMTLEMAQEYVSMIMPVYTEIVCGR